jgi:hypothetical protein
MRREILKDEAHLHLQLQSFALKLVPVIYLVLLGSYFSQVQQWSFFHLLFPLIAIPISFMAAILFETILSFLPGLMVRLRKTVVFSGRFHRN